MSFDKAIGFDLNKHPDDAYILNRFDVPLVKHDLKKLLPPGNKEPEPKILLPRSKCFKDIRALILSSHNACMIPGQLYEEKNPLTSILLDTVQNGFPTAELARNDYSLRFRFETDPQTGRMTQRDYNEKTSLMSAQLIGGCADRDERESELYDSESLEDGYNRFLKKYRDMGDPAFCDKVAFNSLHTSGGYIAARTEYGFAVRHPKHDLLFVFEACEDRFDTLASNMSEATANLHEFEFEPKQVWGRVPEFAQGNREAFKHFLYRSMIEIRDAIHERVPGAQINAKSKAEIAKDHLEASYGLEKETGQTLTKYFTHCAPTGYHKEFIADQYSLMLGSSLPDILENAADSIHQRGARLHEEKRRFNEASPKPCLSNIGYGSTVFGSDNDNAAPRARRPSFSLA